jgi:transposase
MEKTRRKFTAEFKAQALELAETMGSIKGAADALGISAPSLYGWKQSAGRKAMEHPDPGLVAELRNEIKQLRKELKEQQQAVQVLKQATVFFCQDKNMSPSW